MFKKQKVLVLGAYGLIGASVCRHLSSVGFDVVGAGRNGKTARSVLPDLEWKIVDLSKLVASSDWHDLLTDVSIVVNCAGALQDSGKDDLMAIHGRMVTALVEAIAAKPQVKLIQISAVGATPEASTYFMKTKALGDEAIRKSEIDWWIIKPGLVISANSYGGTALLRMAAATPLIQPVAFQTAKVQSVSVDDLASVIGKLALGQLGGPREFDLVEFEEHEIKGLVLSVRKWLGFSPPLMMLPIPTIVAKGMGKAADMLGWLGWRSPLRSTAVKVLSEDVVGTHRTDLEITSLEESLAATPVRVQDRWYARMAFLFPFALATLFFYWLLSGLIGFLSMEEAAKHLTTIGWSSKTATAAVCFWSVVDVVLAGMLMVRRAAKLACGAMVVVALVYLLSGLIFAPHLLIDPLGPLLKILPGLFLPLFVRVMLDDR